MIFSYVDLVCLWCLKDLKIENKYLLLILSLVEYFEFLVGQLLYDRGLFDSFPNKDQVFEKYLTFSQAYLLEEYGKTIPISDGENYLSDFEYSTRETFLKSLKKDSYIDIVDMRHRMKLTSTEIIFVLYWKKDFFLCEA